MDTNKFDHSTIYMISTSNDGGVMGFPFLNQRLRQSAVNIILIDPCVIFFLRIETVLRSFVALGLSCPFA